MIFVEIVSNPPMKKPDPYLLLASCLCLALSACHKQKGPDPILLPTAGMGGAHNWRGHHFYEANGMHYPTPQYESWDIPDTVLTLTVLSDVSIQFMGKVYDHESTDSARNIVYFGYARHFYQMERGNGVAYFRDQDSIVYCYVDVHTTSDYWRKEEILHTY